MKGMDRIKRGNSFFGLIAYQLGRGDAALDDGRIISGNMSGSTPEQLASEFEAIAKTRPDIAKPVWHNSLRMPAGEDVNDRKWSRIARCYLLDMGMNPDQHQWLVVKHDDEGAVHITYNRVGLNGSIYLGKNENLKSTKIISALEGKFGLTRTKSANYDADGKVVMPEKKRISSEEVNKSIRTETAPPREVLQAAIERALSGRPTTAEFLERLEGAGIEVRTSISSTARKMQGISFRLNGLEFKGSSLGSKFAWRKLQNGIDYDEIRDHQELERRTSSAASRLENASGTIDRRGLANGLAEQGAIAGANRRAGELDEKDRIRLARGYENEPDCNAGTRRAADRHSEKARELESEHEDSLKRREQIQRITDRACGEAKRLKWQTAAFDPTANDARRNFYRERMLSALYGSQDPQIAKYWRIDRTRNRTVVYRNKLGEFEDHGAKITASQGNDAEVDGILRLAKIKGWKNIRFSGSEEFKFKAMTRAIEQGWRVSAADESDQKLLDAAKQAVEEARAGRIAAPLESPSLPSMSTKPKGPGW